ncbi:FHA domain-containing protein [Methanogenium sp. S4BF]|uniref:FHA domain-containing protein n=1 Tax=Methanogenium sp. S4BF TaxID=1789226 RepID=UPI0024164CD0|nr:FHA domain-containing protein [Methanogenium sp. S4BF]WFN33597.1 FHA domain-containing protein [Methanogenium sp. S4BF]
MQNNDPMNETVVAADDPEYYADLSEYLNALSNPTRLKILKVLEAGPMELREIAGHIRTSYENTKKHMVKLLNTGVVQKKAGIGRCTSKGALPVWKYSLVSGGMESVIRNLGFFSNIDVRITGGAFAEKAEETRRMVAAEYAGDSPVLVMPEETDEAVVFPLTDVRVHIGRADASGSGVAPADGPDAPARYIPASPARPDAEIVLSRRYEAVTRVSRPHGVIRKGESGWTYEDCRSTSGSYINDLQVHPGAAHPLKDGDVLELARGMKGARFLFIQGDASGGEVTEN